MTAKSDKAAEQLIATENQQPPFAPPSYEEAVSKPAQNAFAPSAPVVFEQIGNYSDNKQSNPSATYNGQIGFSPVSNEQPIVNPPTFSTSHPLTEIKGPERIQPRQQDNTVVETVDCCVDTLLCCSICVDCCQIFQDCNND